MLGGEQFDVVVVGGGPAGCVLAARLSEDPERSVLLVEAGPDYRADPDAWPADLRDVSAPALASHQWGHRFIHPSGGEPLLLPRARVLGGTAAINSCVWLRGSRRDYDAWAAQGNPGWTFDDLLPYFRRTEADPLARSSRLHGADGPVPVFRITQEDYTPVERILLATADRLGFARVTDMNGGEDQEPGIGPAPRNIVGGVRMNPALTYLAPARSRPNLTILPDTLVDRVLFEDRRAVAVQAVDRRVFRGDEVVLTAGAYDSPAILLRSGVGPLDHLAELGIPVVHPLSGVGQKLRDHPFTPGHLLRYRIASGAVPKPFLRVFLKARSRQVSDDVDFHLYWIEDQDTATGAWSLSFCISLMYARSHGSVRLTAANPTAPLAIDLNCGAEPADLEALCDGLELARRLAETPPAASILSHASDVPVWRTREELRERVRLAVGTAHHPSTTCRMGPADDSMAVVDGAGRVHGVHQLRVTDASIFPSCPRANLHFTICAVAEKLAATMRHHDSARAAPPE